MLGYEHIRQLWAAPAADFPSATWGSTVAISVPSGPPPVPPSLPDLAPASAGRSSLVRLPVP